MIEIPENNDGCPLSKEERMDILVQVMMRGCSVTTSYNMYGGGKLMRSTSKDGHVWYSVAHTGSSRDDRYKEEMLFLPTDEEVQKALDMFKAKGWHAYYDSEMRVYCVCKERFARGEYADRFTSWLF